MLSSSLTILFLVALYDLGRTEDAFEKGTVTAAAVENSEDIAALVAAGLILSAAVGGVGLIVWTYATVRRAMKRYPMGRHRPLVASLCWLVPILQAWIPFRYLKRASECDVGVTARGLVTWQRLVVSVYVGYLLQFFIIGGALIGSIEVTWGAALFFALEVYAIAVGVVLCIPIVIAMAETDRATSGIDLAEMEARHHAVM